MAVSEKNYTGNGSTTLFTFTFPYLAAADVKVSLDAVDTTAFTLSNSTTVSMNSAPASGVAIRIYRDSDSATSTALATFAAGSAIKSADLNDNFTQTKYISQEAETNISVTAPLTKTGHREAALAISAATTSAAGSMSAADKTKLDAIEASATADQTASEIKTLYESNSDTNAFTDADHTKLDGIEASATADQTAAEIRTLVESATDSNVFTDADHTKLDGIEASATADQSASEIKTAYESNSNTNAFTDAEQTKLSGIEASATADQSASEIKTAYESNSNTNAFTDAEQTKLSGIATGAEVNVNADWNASSGDAQILNKPTIPSSSDSVTRIIAGTNITLSPTNGYGDVTVTASGVALPDGAVTSAKIADGAIVNADVNASAAIAGTKISPNFGSQSIVTTGAVQCDDLKVNTTTAAPSSVATIKATSPQLSLYAATTGTSYLNMGDTDDHDIGSIQYDNSSNDLKFITNATERLRIDSSGNVELTSTSSSAVQQILFSDGTSGRGKIIYRHDGDSLAFETYSSEKMRIDSSGRLLINHTADVAPNGYSSKLQLCDTSYQGSSMVIRRDSNNSSPPVFMFAKSRSGNKGGDVVLQAGDLTGQILFNGSDGTDSNCLTGYIESAVDGTPGSNDMPGRLSFYTTADGTATSTERLRIDSSGRMLLGTTTAPSLNYVDDFIIHNSSHCGMTIRTGSTTGACSIYFADGTSGASEYAGYIDYQHTSDHMRFGTGGGSEKMRITSAGNVGINTTTPGQKLTVNGDIGAGANLNTGPYFYTDGATGTVTLRNDGSGINSFVINKGGTNNVIIKNDGTTTLAGDCTFAAGTVSAFTSSNHGLLRVYNSSGSQTASIYGALGTAQFGPINISSSTGYGVVNDITANAGGVYAQCQGTASQYTSLYNAYYGAAKVFHVLANGGGYFSGNLGVGTTSPGQKVEVRGTGETNMLLAGTAGSVGGYFYLQNLDATDNNSMVIEGQDAQGQGTSQIQFYNVSHTNNEGAIAFNTRPSGGSMTQAVKIMSTGNTQFAGQQHEFTNSSGTVISAILPGTSYRNLDLKANIITLATGYSSTTTALTVANNQNIGIGTTSPNQLLDVRGNQYLAGTLFHEFNGGSINGIDQINTYNGSGIYNLICRKADNTIVGSITSSTTAVQFNTSSDYRLKENVVDLADGINRVKQLSPKRFNFIADADTTVDGFLAHEAQTVVPEAVTGTKDEVDDEGNAVLQGIDQSKLVPLLTAALQEAIGRIEALETEVAALKSA